MYRRIPIIVGILLLTTISLFAGDTREPLEISLRFTVAGEDVRDEAPDGLWALRDHAVTLVVKDERKVESPAELGDGTNDDDKSFPIRATNEVEPFLAETLERIAREWDLELAKSADRRLELTVRRLYVTERNKAIGSVFRTEIEISYVLSDGGGKKLVSGSAFGDATRYGKARSAENSNEVTSDALVEVLAEILGDSSLQDAWGD